MCHTTRPLLWGIPFSYCFLWPQKYPSLGIQNFPRIPWSVEDAQNLLPLHSSLSSNVYLVGSPEIVSGLISVRVALSCLAWWRSADFSFTSPPRGCFGVIISIYQFELIASQRVFHTYSFTPRFWSLDLLFVGFFSIISFSTKSAGVPKLLDEARSVSSTVHVISYFCSLFRLLVIDFYDICNSLLTPSQA